MGSGIKFNVNISWLSTIMNTYGFSHVLQILHSFHHNIIQNRVFSQNIRSEILKYFILALTVFMSPFP